MRIEICDRCRKARAIGRIAIFFRKLGGSHALFVRHVKNRAYCRRCTERVLADILGKHEGVYTGHGGDVPISDSS